MYNVQLNSLFIYKKKKMYIYILHFQNWKIYIILTVLLNHLNGINGNPLHEQHDEIESNDTMTDTEKTYIKTMQQLERCYLWSRTLAPNERLEYLITLRRKVSDHIFKYHH